MLAKFIQLESGVVRDPVPGPVTVIDIAPAWAGSAALKKDKYGLVEIIGLSLLIKEDNLVASALQAFTLT
jgi:hypothetical protein